MTNFVAAQLERNALDQKIVAVTVPTNVSTEVVPSTIASKEEYISIQIFNAGGNNAYYAYGRTCDTTKNFNAWLVPGQMLDVQCREAVNVFAVGGTTIAVTMIRRVSEPAVSNNIQYPA